MNLSRIETYDKYLSIVDRYQSREGKNNDYIQREAESIIESGYLYEYCDDSNAYIFLQKPVGMRLYYYINDFSVIPDFSDLKEVVIEILYRGDKFYPNQEIEFFQKAGFKINLVRDQYAVMYKDLVATDVNSDIIVEKADSVDVVRESCELFNRAFDALSGDSVSEKEYQKLYENGDVLIAKDCNNIFLGALHQSFVGKVAYIAHVVVIPEARGKHVGRALLDTFIDVNKENGRYMLWVQRQNTAAVNMYQKKGFKYAGKSTISLIRQ